MAHYGSRRVSRIAIEMALTESREEERELKQRFLREGIKTAAVDYGGDFISSVNKIIERAVVASKREDVIREVHADEGAVAGATREALSQIMPKAMGLNVGENRHCQKRGSHQRGHLLRSGTFTPGRSCSGVGTQGCAFLRL